MGELSRSCLGVIEGGGDRDGEMAEYQRDGRKIATRVPGKEHDMRSMVVDEVMKLVAESDLIEFTRAIAKIPSVHEEEQAIAEAFGRHMRELGLETDFIEVEKDRGNVIGRIRGSGGGQSLTLNGHMDTIPHTLGWTKKMYGGEMEDGKIYGHGVSNMKASDTAMVYAADAIRRAGVKLKGDLLIALVVEECHGGVGTQDLMKKGVKTDLFVCGEPTDLNILTVHAFSQTFRVDIWGRSGHFGSHERGVSAIMKMYELVERLGPVHTEIEPGGWIKFEDKPLYHGLPRYHIGTIRGGVTEEFLESWACTPDFCTAVFNVRATPNKSIEGTKGDIEKVLEDMRTRDARFRYRVSILRRTPGFEAPLGSRAVAGISKAYREVMGGEPNVGAIQPFMFMASDSGRMQEAGMKDGVLMGPGAFTSSMQDEYVEVQRVIAAARIYAVTALELCGYSS